MINDKLWIVNCELLGSHWFPVLFIFSLFSIGYYYFSGKTARTHVEIPSSRLASHLQYSPTRSLRKNIQGRTHGIVVGISVQTTRQIYQEKECCQQCFQKEKGYPQKDNDVCSQEEGCRSIGQEEECRQNQNHNDETESFFFVIVDGRYFLTFRGRTGRMGPRLRHCLWYATRRHAPRVGDSPGQIWLWQWRNAL